MGHSRSRREHDWERIAKAQPYWGVLSHRRFLSSEFHGAEQEFWRSGEEYIAEVLAEIDRWVCPAFVPTTALDFGCGVGRLLAPRSKVSELVTGVDVSPTMRGLATVNLNQRGVRNFQLIESLDAVPEYDFLNSTLVFQHIRPHLGYRIFRKLVAGLSYGGCGAVHFRCRSSNKVAHLLHQVRARSHTLSRLTALARREPREAMLVEIHEYDLDTLLRILNAQDINHVTVKTTTANGLDALLLFQKPLSG